jgi:diaminohydroxyphosphoribosylaminopyrimidine deaminase/5-amino-6-(5-phosphoribosylamino)uracil reductase
VDAGILESFCRQINQPFIKHSTTGIPLVTLKAAATLDGRIASRTGDSRWVTNERSRRFVHQLRCSLDAILVGIGTVLADDPMLNVRLKRKVSCRQPIRIVLDSHLRIPATARLVQTAREISTWVACREEAPPAKERELKDAGVEILHVSGSRDRVSLVSLLQELGKRQIASILVEGGAQVHGAFLEQQLADDFYFFYAPKILCDPGAIPMVHGAARERMADALRAYNLRVRRFGNDVMLCGRMREEPY